MLERRQKLQRKHIIKEEILPMKGSTITAARMLYVETVTFIPVNKYMAEELSRPV